MARKARGVAKTIATKLQYKKEDGLGYSSALVFPFRKDILSDGQPQLNGFV